MANLFKKRELTIEEQQMQSEEHKKNIPGMLKPFIFLAPSFIFLAIFTYYPLFNVIWLSFRDYNLLSKNTFIGLENFRRLFFVSKDFLPVVKNTVVYSVSHVLIMIAIAILLAVWFNNNDGKINRLGKRVLFFPHIVAGVSVSMIFAWLMNSDGGLFNQILSMFGLPQLKWLDSSDTAMASIVGVSVWKGVGHRSLIVLAAIAGISAEINEAATLDNTPPWRRMLYITIPMISPQLFYMVVNMTINSFKVFDMVRLLTGGGPGNATNVMVLYIYEYAFEFRRQVGYACAAGVVLLVILLVLTIIYFSKLERKVHYQ